MPNITVSVPDETYRQARIRAAEEGTSVSAMVTNYLQSLGGRDARFTHLEALQKSVLDEVTHFSASDRLARSAVHDRALS